MKRVLWIQTFILRSIILCVLATPASVLFAQEYSPSENLFKSSRLESYAEPDQIDDNNLFCQYSQYTRKNILALNKMDLCRNMDDRIEDLFNNQGIVSYRYLMGETGTSGLISGYHGQYEKHLNKGHRAMQRYHELLMQYPHLFRNSYTSAVGLLLSPFKRQPPSTKISPPNPAQIHRSPIVSVTTPLSVPSEEWENSTDENLPLAPRYPEQPEQLPFFYPPQTIQHPETVDRASPSLSTKANVSTETPSIPELPSPSTPDPVEAVHRSPMQILYDQGLKAFQQRNYPKARERFEQVLSVSPDDSQTQFALGLCLFYSGEYHDSHRAIQCSYNATADQNTPSHDLWQMPIPSKDFQFHYKKLEKYKERHPDDSSIQELLFYLSLVSHPEHSKASY